ncbi:immunity 70 family protein [Scytonema sp. NUACC26]|uniref:immunity 70 family protein n=1 Tax=Scytonema sp. NUACC26 TaxID=3140176 RepID=UPI0034DBFC47
MVVGFQVGNIIDEVGSSDLLHAFFSTISYHLEPKGWGSEYPELTLKLYEGELSVEEASKAYNDLISIRERLKAFSPEWVIWDIDDLEAKPPWDNQISPTVTDLSNYFLTSTGRDLFEVLLECLQALQEEGGSLTIEKI